jgi:hypothetical protein
MRIWIPMTKINADLDPKHCFIHTFSKKLDFGSSMGSNPDISQKYEMGDISKGVANTL